MQSDEVRVAPDGALVCCRSEDGGQSWQELRAGLPQRHCYDIVFRHAMDAKGGTVLFGTTCGTLYGSEDRGDSWTILAAGLPPISSIRGQPS
jgi:photosystem II stability/assembly factor-like uncharacterized protein